jgi:hypothetical protein
MYSALWKILPGPFWFRVIQVIILVTATVFVLFEWVFPWIAQTFLTEESTVDSQSSVYEFNSRSDSMLENNFELSTLS